MSAAMIDGQLDLLDALDQIEEDQRLTCPCCGRVEGNDFLLSLNHGIRYDAEGQRINPYVTVCVAMDLTRNHALHSRRRLDPAEWEDYPKCINHPSARKPCPQAHFEAEYEHYAERATRAWGSEAWKADV